VEFVLYFFPKVLLKHTNSSHQEQHKKHLVTGAISYMTNIVYLLLLLAIFNILVNESPVFNATKSEKYFEISF